MARKRLFGMKHTLPLALFIAAAPPASILLYGELTERITPEPITQSDTYAPADASIRSIENARKSLPKEIVDGMVMTDIYHDAGENTFYATLVVPRDRLSTAFNEMRTSNMARMTKAACAEGGGLAEGHPRTVLEFKSTPEGRIYQTMTVADIFCDG